MKIDHELTGTCYTQGYRTLHNNGIALLGISPGNPYFKQSIITSLIDFSAHIFSKIYIVIPDKPYEHTCKALGYTDSASTRIARKKGNALKNMINKSISLKTNAVPIHLLDWHMEVESSSHYQEKLQAIYALYRTNKEFYCDVHEEIMPVIKNYPHKKVSAITENILEEGAHYMLKEIAFCVAFPEILQTDNVAMVYHKEWHLWQKFSSGRYNQEIPKIGFVKIS